jgi:hypothetical protein
MVDDLEEHVGRIGPVREVADLIDHEHVGVYIRSEGVDEPAFAGGGGQLVDELGCAGEAGVVAVLNGPVRDRDGQVRFASASAVHLWE